MSINNFGISTLHEAQLRAEPDHKAIVTGFTRNDTGFTIQFPNGYGLSVQWSTSHLCSQSNGQETGISGPHSATAECCEVTPRGLGKVHAHCSPDTVLRLLRKMERKQTAAERAAARQCRIENAQRKHGWQDTPEYAPKGDDNAND